MRTSPPHSKAYRLMQVGKFCADVFDACGTFISGYAFDPDDPERTLEIELLYRSRVAAKGVANRFDESQFCAGIAAGNRAFRIEVPRYLQISSNGPVRLAISGGPEIPTGPRTLFELFKFSTTESLADHARLSNSVVYHGGFITV